MNFRRFIHHLSFDDLVGAHQDRLRSAAQGIAMPPLLLTCADEAIQ